MTSCAVHEISTHKYNPCLITQSPVVRYLEWWWLPYLIGSAGMGGGGGGGGYVQPYQIVSTLCFNVGTWCIER